MAQSFTEKDRLLFKTLAALTQERLRDVMYEFLKKKYKKIKKVEGNIVAQGNIPVCLVAHLDTVHRSPVREMYYDSIEDVLWSPQGLGADDRAGVYSIVRLVERGWRPSIILTCDEEIGGLGSLALIKQYPNKCPLKGINCFIQIDRRGAVDSVYYDCANKDFENYINSFGFVTAIGSFSDISILCEEWEIAGVNLSSGYYNEHSFAEYLVTKQLNETIQKIEQILIDYPKEQFKYIPNPRWKAFTSSNKCDLCGQTEDSDLLIDIILNNNTTGLVCLDCIENEEKTDWCHSCGNLYQKIEKSNNIQLCPKCKEYFKEHNNE